MSHDIKVIIIDDEQDMRDSISQWLGLSGYKTKTYPNADMALKDIKSNDPSIIISDIKMPGTDGVTFLKKIQKIDRTIPVILITGHGDVAMAVEAMRIGAYDFLEKPFNPERMAEITKRAFNTRKLILENRILRMELSDNNTVFSKLMGQSSVVQRLREDILDMAQADGHILITGETGTGKSLIAHAVHACSSRSNKNFVVVNCAAYTEDELARRLFGLDEISDGYIAMAMNGTLCLEDIESLPSSLQGRLLSLITADSDIPQKHRIIAISNDTTDQPLNSILRQDLYFRLAALQLTPPPLSERGEDILHLFNHFLEIYAEEYGTNQPDVTAEDAALLLQAHYPGNVRQLINLAERSVLQNRRGNFSIANMLSNAKINNDDTDTKTTKNTIKPLKEHVEAFERMLIDNAMRKYKGSIQHVMSELSLPRRTLNEKMAKYKLVRSNYIC